MKVMRRMDIPIMGDGRGKLLLSHSPSHLLTLTPSGAVEKGNIVSDPLSDRMVKLSNKVPGLCCISRKRT